MSAAKVGGTTVSACTKAIASPCDARAPACICRARPRDATISASHNGRACSTLASMLPPSTTTISASGAPHRSATSVLAIAAASLSIGTTTERVFTVRESVRWRIHQRRRIRRVRTVLDDNPAALDFESPLLEQRDRVRENAMLLLLDARCQPLFVVAGQHGHSGLHDHRADIDARRDEEYGASRDLDAIFDRILRPVDSRKRRQQAVVNIHDAAGKRFEHHRRQQPHKARQRKQLDLASLQRGEDGAVEVLARRELAMVDDRRLDSVTARALESLRLGAIRNDETDFGFEIAVQNRVDDGLQIGAAAGNQDAEFDRRIFRHRINRGSAKRHSTLAPSYFADDVGGKFAAAQMRNDAIGLARRHNRDHSEAVVEGAIHLGAVDFPEALNQAEYRRRWPTAALDDGASIRRHHARQIFEHAAAGYIRETIYFEALEQFDDYLRVDERRAQQLFAEGASEFADARTQLELRMFQHAAHQ